LLPLISYFKILENGANVSDHLPIALCLAVPVVKCDETALNDSFVHEFRWDKGDIANFYKKTGLLLNNIAHDFPCMQCDFNCSIKDCHVDVDIYYNEIVHCLMEASRCNIQKIPWSALKHYSSAALDDLKSDSMFACSVWKCAGRPQSGPIYERKKNAHYLYKLAIRDAANQFEDELLDSYMNKDFTSFWKCWKKKTCSKTPRVSSVGGISGDANIANRFAGHFSNLGINYSLQSYTNVEI